MRFSESVTACGHCLSERPSTWFVHVDGLWVSEWCAAEFVNAVDAGFEVDADSDQLFRVLINLSRNAVEAMAADDSVAVNR